MFKDVETGKNAELDNDSDNVRAAYNKTIRPDKGITQPTISDNRNRRAAADNDKDVSLKAGETMPLTNAEIIGRVVCPVRAPTNEPFSIPIDSSSWYK